MAPPEAESPAPAAGPFVAELNRMAERARVESLRQAHLSQRVNELEALRAADAERDRLYEAAREDWAHYQEAFLAYWESRYKIELEKRRSLQASRSWRWTAPLRALEKLLGARAGAAASAPEAPPELPAAVALFESVYEKGKVAAIRPPLPDPRVEWVSPADETSPWNGGRVLFSGRLRDASRALPSRLILQFNGEVIPVALEAGSDPKELTFSVTVEMGPGLNVVSLEGLWEDGIQTNLALRYFFFDGKYPGRSGTLDEGYADWIAAIEPGLLKLPVGVEFPPEVPGRPLFSIVTPVFNPPVWAFKETVDSVLQQAFADWEWIIVDDCSTDSELVKFLQQLEGKDSRIKVIFREENGHISRASNTGIEAARGEFLVLLDHDDLLRPVSLAWVASEIARHPEGLFFYSDEDTLSEEGVRYNPHFKPDYNPHLFLAHNTITHLAALRLKRVREVGMFRPETVGAQDYDLFLRYLQGVDPSTVHHIPRVLYHWRSLESSTSRAIGAKPYALEAGCRALQDHLASLSLPAGVSSLPQGGFHRIAWPEAAVTPLIHLDLRNGLPVDWPAWLGALVAGLKAFPADLRVDWKVGPELNDDQRDALANALKPWALLNGDNTPSPFTWVIAAGVVPQPDAWRELAGWLSLPGVSAVGGNVLNRSNDLTLGGLATGEKGKGARDLSRGIWSGDPGYMNRWRCPQTVSVLTASHYAIRGETLPQVEESVVAGEAFSFVFPADDFKGSLVWTPWACLDWYPVSHDKYLPGEDEAIPFQDPFWPRHVMPLPGTLCWAKPGHQI